MKSNHAIEEESIQTFQTTCQGNLYVFSFKHFFSAAPIGGNKIDLRFVLYKI